MTTPTTATLQRISRERLSTILLNPSSSSSIAIVDVRDDDYIGGHINSSINIPSGSLDHKLPQVAEDLAQKDIVVFHCSLSQQRGPSAALKYLRERDGGNKDGKSGVKEGEIDKEKAEKGEGQQAGKGKKEQEVYVLHGGFVKWQEEYVFSLPPLNLHRSEGFWCQAPYGIADFFCSCYIRYGRDARLTEGYVPEMWQDNSY